jgi:hypothetical protein
VLSLESRAIANTLLTPTLKFRRANLEARFAPETERLIASDNVSVMDPLGK